MSFVHSLLINHWLNLIILVRLADHLTRVHEVIGDRKEILASIC